MAGQNNPQAGFTFLDYDGETSVCSGYTVQPTAVNMTAYLADVGSLRDALDDITLGTIQREYGQVYNTLLDNTLPTDMNAQRERKWKVFAEDVTEFLDIVNAVRNPNFRQITTYEIPTAAVTDPDTNPLLLEGTDMADPANPYIIAFVDAYEAFHRSDAIGTLEVIEIRLVGRNS